MHSCFSTLTFSDNRRLKAFHEHSNDEKESINYPHFLLNSCDYLTAVIQDGYDRIMLPPSVRQVKELKHLVSNTFH